MKNRQLAQKASFAVTVALFALTLWFCIYLAATMIGACNAKIDSSNDALPGASAIGKAMGIWAILISFWLFGSFLSLFGFVWSALCRKKATILFIRRCTTACMWFYGVISTVIVGSFAYVVIRLSLG